MLSQHSIVSFIIIIHYTYTIWILIILEHFYSFHNFASSNCILLFCVECIIPSHLGSYFFLVFTEPIIILLCAFFLFSSHFLNGRLERIHTRRRTSQEHKKKNIAHINAKNTKLTNNKSKLTNNYLLLFFSFFP